MQERRNSNPVTLFIGMIMFSFFSSAHTQIASPVISAMVADLGITSTTAVGMISTLPSLTCIPSVLICGKLCEKASKKFVWVVGAAIWLVGGYGAALFDNITMVLVFRGILGVGCGLVIPLVTAIPVDYYPGSKAATQIGVNTGIAGLWGALLGILSGALAGSGWQTAFLLHLAAIPVVVIGCICVPSKPTVLPETSSGTAVEQDKGKLPGVVFLYAIIICVSMLPIMACWSYASVFIAEESLATEAQAGTAISMITLFSAVSSLLYGKIAAFFKRLLPAFGFGCIALAFVFLLLFRSYATVIIGLAFLGLSMGILVPYVLAGAAMASSLARQTMAQSIVLCGTYAGQFLSSVWYTLATWITGSTSARAVFNFNMWVSIALTALFIVTALFRKKEN